MAKTKEFYRMQLIVLIILAFITPLYAQQTITLTTHIQPPLTWLTPEGEPTGDAMKPVLYALNKMNIHAEIRFEPWTRAQLMVKNGEAAGFFAGSRNADRDAYAVRSAPIADQTINWYLLKETLLDPSDTGFKARATVGGYTGAAMLQWLQDNGYNVTGKPNHPDQLFLMLINKRFDACLANTNNYNNFLAAYPQYTDRIRVVEQTRNDLFVYFSPRYIEQNPDFLTEFNSHIQEYRKTR